MSTPKSSNSAYSFDIRSPLAEAQLKIAEFQRKVDERSAQKPPLGADPAVKRQHRLLLEYDVVELNDWLAEAAKRLAAEQSEEAQAQLSIRRAVREELRALSEKTFEDAEALQDAIASLGKAVRAVQARAEQVAPLIRTLFGRASEANAAFERRADAMNAVALAFGGGACTAQYATMLDDALGRTLPLRGVLESNHLTRPSGPSASLLATHDRAVERALRIVDALDLGDAPGEDVAR